MKRTSFLLLFALFLLPVYLQAQQSRLINTYGNLPLIFEPNVGQTDPQAKFICRGAGYSLFLKHSEMVLVLRHRKAESKKDKKDMMKKFQKPEPGEAEVLRVKLVGGNESGQTELLDQLEGRSNYFIGNDPSKWHTDIPNYAKVKLHEVYPGIDLVYYGNQRQVEHDFVVKSGADPKNIQFSFTGAEGLSIDQNGNLIIKTSKSQIVFKKPDIYQEIGGVKTNIASGYVLEGENQVGLCQVFGCKLLSPRVVG